MKAFREALRASPKFFSTHLNLGTVLVMLGDRAWRKGENPTATWAEAEKLFSRARKRNIDAFGANLCLASLYRSKAEWAVKKSLKDLPAAVERLRYQAYRLLQISPDSPKGYRILAYSFLLEAKGTKSGKKDFLKLLDRARDALKKGAKKLGNDSEFKEMQKEIEALAHRSKVEKIQD